MLTTDFQHKISSHILVIVPEIKSVDGQTDAAAVLCINSNQK
jgi:hypothetical protein